MAVMEERQTAGARVSGIHQRGQDLVVCHRGSCDHVSDSTMHTAEATEYVASSWTQPRKVRSSLGEKIVSLALDVTCTLILKPTLYILYIPHYMLRNKYIRNLFRK